MDESTPLIKKIGKWFRNDLDEGKNEERVEEEIIQMVSEGQEQGAIDIQEAEMISNIMEFDDKVASEVMTHRKNIIAFEVNTSLQDAAVSMANGRFSRYPVYEEEMDNIVGILHIKDVLKFLLAHPDGTDIRQVMRKPYFVPETQNISRLFREMKNKSQHMAIIIDEYGQTFGLVTMEDILEEIVGNIMDEHDDETKEIVRCADGSYVTDGIIDLKDLEELLDIEFEKDEYETLNGFMIDKLDRIPAEGETWIVEYEGYKFTSLEVDNNAIESVKIEKINK
jgi:putative hemolysin